MIGERKTLHDDLQRGLGADDAARLGAHQFGRVRVALLRHDRRAGGELVGKLDEAELCRRPDDDLLGEARQVDGAEARRRQRLDDEVAVGDAVERVRRRPVEAKRRGGLEAVDRERGAGQRRGAERVLVEAPARVLEAAAVTADHLDIGEQMVAESHRLGALQMGEARHHLAGMGEGLVGERHLQLAQRRVHRVDRVAHPELEIGRHLVVARAGGVQPSGGVADQFLQARFDVEVDVLERARKLELARFDFAQDGV